MSQSGCFKEETCSRCPNFMTVPACYKCRVYTGDPCAPDFSGKGIEVTKSWKDYEKACDFIAQNFIRME